MNSWLSYLMQPLCATTQRRSTPPCKHWPSQLWPQALFQLPPLPCSHTLFFSLLFFLVFLHMGSWFPDQGSNLCPPYWKHGVLTIGPPGKSLWVFLVEHVLSLYTTRCSTLTHVCLTPVVERAISPEPRFLYWRAGLETKAWAQVPLLLVVRHGFWASESNCRLGLTLRISL